MTVNASTFRLVASVLGLALLGAIAAISVLAGLHDDIPTILENIATGALTALAALLVSPHSDEPTPVSVVDQPVAVTDAPKKTARRRTRGDAGHLSEIVLAVIVALGIVGIIVTVVIGIVAGTSAADRHRVQQVRACVAAGNQWVRGDCVRTVSR